MSYTSGLAALNLEMTDRVPRTEYSAQGHWPLVQEVTGIDTSVEKNRGEASKEFVKAWDYAFMWMTPSPIREDMVKSGWYTDMGHAEYAHQGTDRRDSVFCPFKDVEDIYSFDPIETYGVRNHEELVKELNESYIKTRDYWGDVTLTMGGVYQTMFSGFIDMFGWDLLLTAMGMDSVRFGSVIERYAEWVSQYFNAWAQTDIEVFMDHDDICWSSGPVTSPDWYREYIFPHYKKLWAPILKAGKKLIFTSDGKYDMFYDDIVECGAHMLVLEPYNDMKLFAEKYGQTHGFVGNADTRILLLKDKEEIYAEVKRCMDIGKECPGFIMAVGNHIPANTPIENALYYNEAYLELSRR